MRRRKEKEKEFMKLAFSEYIMAKAGQTAVNICII
jgi:hypothetical protein